MSTLSASSPPFLPASSLSAHLAAAMGGSAAAPLVNPMTGRRFTERFYKIREKRQQLPVSQFLEQLHASLIASQVVIVEGETGSGKTTQIPQFLVQAGWCVGVGKDGKRRRIACTQPRRVAAISIAARVAEEMDCELGEEVGYTIRFDDKTGPRTVLTYLTDGMLLFGAMADPTLDRYSVIIIDEAHERALSTDILLSLLKELLAVRSDLKVVVMSATLHAAKFQAYFDGAPLLRVPGRAFPVEIFYTPEPVSDYLEAAVRTVLQVHQMREPGDVLLFLTGEQEIEEAAAKIAKEAASFDPALGQLIVVPLYSALSPAAQQRIFSTPPGPTVLGGKPGRKVVISTNLAESSLTIDGIVYVIDPGYSKQKVYNPRIRMQSLLVSPISRASANQRAGRAGRTQPGMCFRLYTERSFHKELQEQTSLEIQRSALSGVVLTLKKLGIDDLVRYDFMDTPAPEALMSALEELIYLGALDTEGTLTPLGHKMSALPLEPQLAKMLLAAPALGVGHEVLSITALLSVPRVFTRPKDAAKEADAAKAAFAHEDGDHLTLLNAYNAWMQAGQTVDFAWNNFLDQRALIFVYSARWQLGRILKSYMRHELVPADVKAPAYFPSIRKALAAGFFMQVAHRQSSGAYFTVKDKQVVALHPSASLGKTPEWVLYHEFMLTTEMYIRTVTAVHGEWLLDIAPHYYDPSNLPEGETRVQLRRYYEAAEAERRRGAGGGGAGAPPVPQAPPLPSRPHMTQAARGEQVGH